MLVNVITQVKNNKVRVLAIIPEPYTVANLYDVQGLNHISVALVKTLAAEKLLTLDHWECYVIQKAEVEGLVNVAESV